MRAGASARLRHHAHVTFVAENGDFEDSPENVINGANPDKNVKAGSNDIPYWTVGKGDVDLQRRDPGEWGFAQSGDFHIDLNGRNAGSIQQVGFAP